MPEDGAPRPSTSQSVQPGASCATISFTAAFSMDATVWRRRPSQPILPSSSMRFSTSLAILMYHKVDRILPGTLYPGNHVLPEAFDEQLAELKRWNYQSITLEEWIAHKEKRAELPRRPIIITFDDGYRSTYHSAWPILRRHGFSATV